MQGKDKKDLSNKYNFPCLEENIAKKSLISLWKYRKKMFTDGVAHNAFRLSKRIA